MHVGVLQTNSSANRLAGEQQVLLAIVTELTGCSSAVHKRYHEQHAQRKLHHRCYYLSTCTRRG